MGKTYDEDDFARIAGIMSEQVADQMSVLVENVESMIGAQIKPVDERLSAIEEKLETMEFMIAKSNKEIRSFDVSLGKLEKTINENFLDRQSLKMKIKEITDSLRHIERNTTSQQKQHLELEQRITKLEHLAA